LRLFAFEKTLQLRTSENRDTHQIVFSATKKYFLCEKMFSAIKNLDISDTKSYPHFYEKKVFFRTFVQY